MALQSVKTPGKNGIIFGLSTMIYGGKHCAAKLLMAFSLPMAYPTTPMGFFDLQK